MDYDCSRHTAGRSNDNSSTIVNGVVMEISDFLWLGCALFVTYVSITVLNNHGILQQWFTSIGVL